MGKRNMRVRNVKRTANGATGLKSAACEALDAVLNGTPESIQSFHGRHVAYSGKGAMRYVFASHDGTNVYKVAKDINLNILNESEFDNMMALRSDPETRNVHTPTTLMYVDGYAIIAMTFRPIDGVNLGHRAAKVARDAAARKGIGDMHGHNYRGTPSGRVKITDAGDVIMHSHIWS